jgi:Xaa-Pro dipeptidase
MAEAGLDGLFLATGTNLLFLSGYPALDVMISRPFYFVLPSKGPPVLLVHMYFEAEARRYSWVADVRSYEQMSVAPLTELAAVFHDLRLAGGRVGAELGFEHWLGMPVLEFERVRAEFSSIRFVDAADLLWRLRMVKDADDIAALREACRVTGQAYDVMFQGTRLGDTYPSTQRRMEQTMTDLGGRRSWAYITSGAGTYEMQAWAPSDRAIEPGEMVWLDAGCSIDNFCSDFSRAGVLGKPSKSQLDAHGAILEVTALGVAMVRPGVPVADIASAVNEGVRTIGFPVLSRMSDLAGRVGHGLGYTLTEPPHVSETDPTILRPGMVISIEPGVATADGRFHAEENVLVTSDDHEILSTCSPELRAISVG